MTDAELWEALESLDDDFLDADMPQDIVDEELRLMGVDPGIVEAFDRWGGSHEG